MIGGNVASKLCRPKLIKQLFRAALSDQREVGDAAKWIVFMEFGQITGAVLIFFPAVLHDWKILLAPPPWMQRSWS